MTDFIYRTEDLPQDELANLFVDTPDDRKLVDGLKNRQPTILVGSRGVGKSLLLRVAETELQETFATERVLPVYVSFSKSSLINNNQNDAFTRWMLARACSRLVRKLQKCGLVVRSSRELSLISGGGDSYLEGSQIPIEEITQRLEDSWQTRDEVPTQAVPTVDDLKDAIADLCEDLDIKRICFLFDEAAHVFRPEQQRQFFTLFRDLRSSHITCNAAVYPGTTSYGEIFQPAHDATMMVVERDVSDRDYVDRMRQIVRKQSDSVLLTAIERNGNNFAALAYAAHGNPRILLKTVARAAKLSTKEANETIRDYFRNDIWSEHSSLAGKYSGHKALVDWGRRFIEDRVLGELAIRNQRAANDNSKTTCYFWIHRDAPAVVHEAIRLLAYVGIVIRHGEGIRATMSQVGDRFAVCLGCLFSQDATPVAVGVPIAGNLSPVKGLLVYGAASPAYQELLEAFHGSLELDTSAALSEQLQKPIAVLDLPQWLLSNLEEAGFASVADVLKATEAQIQTAWYVGKVRSRFVKTAATNAVLEYLSG